VIRLHFPDAHSLKGKRKDLASVKAQLQTRHHVAVAETDHQETWQRSTLTVALTGGSHSHVLERTDAVTRWLDDRFPAGVSVERIVASVEDLRA
jgi:hypothetical protein